MSYADPLKTEEFALTNSIIYECPALRLPQSFVQKLGGVAQIVILKGCDADTAQFIVDACNAAIASAPLPNGEIERKTEGE